MFARPCKLHVHVLVNINSKKGVDRLQKRGSTGSDVGVRECLKRSSSWDTISQY